MSSFESTSPPILRPVGANDADGIWRLLEPAASDTMGMTSLPHSAAAAATACADSAATLAELATGSFELSEGSYRRILFVACDSADSAPDPLGITGITFKRGIGDLSVQVGTSEDGLGLVMRSSSAPWTRTELNSSFLSSTARSRRLGTLLSRGRTMFLQLVRSQVPETVASHLRGRFDETGNAPFWQCFGGHFAPHWATSVQAELALSENPDLLDSLAGHVLPLTAPVLDYLGPVNSASLPAFHVLMAEGLTPNGRYDPIDGGPTLTGHMDMLTTARTRRHGRLVQTESVDSAAPDSLVAVASVAEFRVTRTNAVHSEAGLSISPMAATALNASVGTLLAASALNSPRRPDEQS